MRPKPKEETAMRKIMVEDVQFWIDYDEKANKTLAMSDQLGIRIICDGEVGESQISWGMVKD
jgi:hypothetical protein